MGESEYHEVVVETVGDDDIIEFDEDLFEALNERGLVMETLTLACGYIQSQLDSSSITSEAVGDAVVEVCRRHEIDPEDPFAKQDMPHRIP